MDKTLITVLIYLGIALFGYLFGCFSISYAIAKKRGFDIRTQGTKNAGASNAAVTMGWKIGVLVGFCDIMKGFIAVFIVQLIFKESAYILAPYVAGVACVIGHMHPFYLKFRGGKGFASYLGMILAIDWLVFLIIVALVLTISLLSDYIVLGTLTTMISFPIFNLIFHRDIVAVIMTAALSAIIIFRHRNSLVNIFKGKERRISAVFFKKKSRE